MVKDSKFLGDNSNKVKYVAYVRKSTEEDDRQTLSKKAQAEEIKRQFPSLDITFIESPDGKLGESMSAASPGRPMFNQMMEEIESGKYQGIIAWHPDRLSRNALDAARVVWDVQKGYIKDLLFCNFTFEPTAEGIMMLQMMMSQAQYFSAKLSKDVKRGNKAKRQKGQFTGPTPMGYITVSSTENGRNTHAEPDPKRFDIVREALLKYASGLYSVTEIVYWLNNGCHFITPSHGKKGGRPMTNGVFYTMLRNPRYAGMLNDPEHPGDPQYYTKGTYTPMLTVEDYNRIQKRLGEKGGPRLPHVYNFPFKGLLTCGECGSAITAEKKTKANGKTYTYYRCTHKKCGAKCKQKAVTENELARQLDELLARYTISDELYNWGLKALEELSKEERFEQSSIQNMQHESLKMTQAQLDRLLDLVARGVIEPDDYTKKSQPLKERMRRIQEEQVEANASANSWYDIVEKTLTRLHKANDNYKLKDIGTKKLIINAIGSDAILQDKTISVTPHNWVKPIADFILETKEDAEKVRTRHQQRKNSLKQANYKEWCT